MPINQSFDFAIDGKPFMLRRQQDGSRSWRRTGIPDLPSKQNIGDAFEYGGLSDAIDHVEVWDDWSGGFGDAYRRPDHPNGYHWALNLDCRFPRQVIHCQAPQLLAARYTLNMDVAWIIDVPSTGTNPPVGAGSVLVLARNFVASYAPTAYYSTPGSAFDALREEGGGGSTFWGDRPALYGSFVFLPRRDGGVFQRRTMDGLTYTTGPVPARWFAAAGGQFWLGNPGSSQNLISVPATAAAQASGGPINTALYTAMNIGVNSSEVVADAVAVDNLLYVGVPDGLYEGNLTGTFNNVLADLGAPVDSDNCRALSVHNGGVVAAAGPRIFWFKKTTTGNIVREIGPSSIMSNRSAIRGKFTCVKGYGQWLYAGLFTGSASYFLAGRDASPGLPYVWHPLHNFLGLTCKVSMIHVDGITSASDGTPIPNRIWCATEASFGSRPNATAPLFVWPIPKGDGNSLSDATFTPNYMGSGRLDLGIADWGAPGTPKIARSFDTWTDRDTGGGLSVGASTSLYVQVDGSTRSFVGQIKTSPKSTVYFGAGSGAWVTGQSFALSIDSIMQALTLDASGNPQQQAPVFRSFVLHGTLRPNVVGVIEAVADCGDSVIDRYGTPMRPGSQMLTDLRGFALSAFPSTLQDISGATVPWVAVQGQIQEEEYWQEGEVLPGVSAIVRMAILDYTPSILPTGEVHALS